MRVMVVASPGTGHVFPLVPMSWALRSDGHDVLVASAGDGVQRASSAGLTAVDVAPGVDMYGVFQSVGRSTGGWAPHPSPAVTWERAVQLFSRVSELMLAGTERVARRWRPDVVVYGESQVAGAVVAARLGIPAVEHGIGLVGDGAAFVGEIWPRLTNEPAVDPVAIIRIAPPSLGPEPAAGRWIMRPVPYNGGAVVPEELLDPPSRPRVLITMGTVAPRLGAVGMVRDLVDAASAEPLEILVALGSDPADLGPLPESVRAYQWLPLTAALPSCSVVIHHGGAGSTLSSLAAGVPQVVVPQGADQFLNAAAVSQRGCATTTDAVPTAIQDGLRRALCGEFDHAAREVREEIAVLPSPTVIAARLVEHLTA
jgi:UDP:flavonoid glycosyltransferase YjiC (YdhE family)